MHDRVKIIHTNLFILAFKNNINLRWDLKGVLRKMKGGKGFIEKYSKVIATYFNSICCVFKEIKTTNTKERSVHTHSESNIQLGL